MPLRSKEILNSEDSAPPRSLFKGMGYTDTELADGRPLIGIANTWNTLVPGHYNFDRKLTERDEEKCGKIEKMTKILRGFRF